LKLYTGYFLLGLTSTVLFRTVRDALPHDLATQERILGASLGALAVADVRIILIFSMRRILLLISRFIADAVSFAVGPGMS
jgi:hypothetical protein